VSKPRALDCDGVVGYVVGYVILVNFRVINRTGTGVGRSLEVFILEFFGFRIF